MSPQLTLGRLARATGLARSSLLHYEALGLLKPLARSESGYRLYGEAEVQRLQAIRRYREAGLSLEAIQHLLSRPHAEGPAHLLEQRLLALSDEVQRLREQQQELARLLAMPEFHALRRARGKADWVALLRQAGFSDDDMQRWHAGFEAAAPEQHQAFLKSLGLSAKEVAAIRHAATSATLRA
ncbi:DNA-binding transcriptional MerR regulator [Pelomonas saccharophila]|uniref:DNA-binding transcriptional MerR regulator n=1 Tax=Roseateles saccharophilus TaxID=304 RepID=A0ABU1YJ02_ROSSA|nr:MerR family transcriptional regulator [Roseateles saccharophilus]MDR7268016.1 DNA-binding transcriptional MerR regulator [Roseateles saccharophilus]